MKIRVETGIYGVPARLNLCIKLLYGDKDQYEKKLIKGEFSLDSGGHIDLPIDYFQNNKIIRKEIDK